MEQILASNNGDAYKDPSKNQNQRDITTQAVISIALGIVAFLAFCFARPRWTGLYAARKRQKNAASILPELPDTFFGWLPALYRITEEEVLASAGLDAFVFLAFFRMATKYIAITFFFSLVIMLPIHVHDTGDYGLPRQGNFTSNHTSSAQAFGHSSSMFGIYAEKPDKHDDIKPTESMLWMYVFFVYLFSALCLYLIVSETKKIIRTRQDYLGSQSTVTDRTIRLSGIPEELRSEEMIKETIENLGIGKVESVLLCKDWRELDDLMAKRMSILRKLEEAWTVHMGHPKHGGNRILLQGSTPGPNLHDEESSRLTENDDGDNNHKDVQAAERPQTRIWYGFMKLQSRKIDAIDYYEEKLRKLDERIKSSRKKVFKPTPLAFVTLDSTAAAMSYGRTPTSQGPAECFVLGRSPYLENIGKVWPQLADALSRHEISRSLIQQGLPTLLISLLGVAVPYIYYWLSTLQGMISQGEVEMSLISKNYFFTFFNLFVVFTIFGTASNATGYFNQIGDSLKDTTSIAYVLANSLKNLVLFYINLIILQGLGLFPFRLLEFGSAALYPIYLLGAKTPRDYAELVAPPVFSYGFYLPQTILIFIICIVYSVLPGSWFVLFFGLIYFIIGNFIYKYQLLYAMDHRRHSTGGAWPIICNRIVVGLVVFQLAMTGILGLSLAVYRAVLIVPLIVFSVWFMVYYQRTYAPLMKFIAIRSLNHDPPFGAIPHGQSRYESETSGGRDVDEDEGTGLRYINPSLIAPLEDVWLAKKRPNGTDHNGNGSPEDV
ncbi:calcium permeable stress-gated cation channel, partial [Lecanoromycetidae sp. Uapishka_2]